MNRRKAYDHMLYGGKVTHKGFTDEEYIHFDGNKIVTEEGYKFGNQFWLEDRFKEGWKKYKAK